jgi:F420-non-reducing hydrogenase small subunit
VAWGTCAVFGGVPALANAHELEELIEAAYGATSDAFGYYLSGAKGVGEGAYQEDGLALSRRADRLDAHVRVDYYVPGCPPRIELLLALLDELAGGEPPKIPATVCGECPRKPDKGAESALRVVPDAGLDRAVCLASTGAPCMGLVTRGGCAAACPAQGLLCWGCRGPAKNVAAKLDRGDTLDHAFAGSFAKRSRTDEAEVAAAVRDLHRAGHTALSMPHHVPVGEERIR